MHQSIRNFLQVATARSQVPQPNARQVEDIAGEMHASIQQRIESGDEAAVLLLAMLTQLAQTDTAATAARLEAAAASKAAAKEAEAAEAAKRARAGLPARGDKAMEA